MVGLVSGNGLGLFNSSQDILGLSLGQSNLGQAKGSAQVNVATGNLSVQFLDESLSGTGADLHALRTYNSMGALNDGDKDGWRWIGEKRITLMSGSAGAANSVVKRVMGDGSETLFAWDASRGHYLSTDGAGAHDTLKWNAGTNQWVFNLDGSTVEERYNGTTGWIQSLRDGSGNGFNYAFSGDKLTKISDLHTGQTLELTYGSNGKLSSLGTRTSATGALTGQIYYSYDSAGRLTSVKTDLTPNDNSITDNNVYTTSYTYAGTSTRIASIVQSDGSTASFTYHADGRVATVSDQTGTTSFTYNAVTTTVTNGLGQSWTYTYDAQQRLTHLTSTLIGGVGQSTSYTYDVHGNVATITDGRGQITTYSYDANGNRIREVDALGNILTRTFGSLNQLLTETRHAPAPATTRYVYDSVNRLRFIVSAEGRVSENRYNSWGLVTSSHQYAGKTYALGQLGAGVSLTEAQLNTWLSGLTGAERSKTQLVTYAYDLRGNLSSQTQFASVNTSGVGVLDSAADVSKYTYSEHGQLLQTIAVRGAARTTETVLSSVVYDGMGRQLSVVNASGTTTTSYAGVNTTISNTATGLTVISTTDSLGRLTSLTSSGDGSSRISRHYYDQAGQLRMTQDPTGARSFFFYDHAGRLNAKVDAAGGATVYTHDRDGRVLTETHYANAANTAAWFNGSSVTKQTLTVGTSGTDIITNSANDRKTTYVYDAAGRLLTSTQDGASGISNTYDGASRLIQTTQGSRVTQYFYDQDGRQIGALDAEKTLSENLYDGAGRLIQTIRYATRVTTVAAFASMKTAVSSGPTLSNHFYYDAEGRMVGTVNEQGFLSETVYDAANNQRKTVQYMTAVVVAGSDTLATLKTRGGAAQTTTTHFDSFGRVSSVVTHDGTVSRNIYDTAGRVIRQIQAEGSTDQRAVRTRYNAFSEVTGMVSGVGEATLAATPTAAAINTAISTYGTSYLIDGMGRRVTELGPQGQKTFLFYNAAGQLTYTANALGEVTKTSYNSFGQVKDIHFYTTRLNATNLASITAGGSESLISGKVVANVATDTVIATTYSKLGQVATQVDGEGFVTTNTYTTYGQLYETTRTLSAGVSVRDRFEYDLLGRLKDSTYDIGGLAAKTSVVYDGFGRIHQTLDANRRTTTTTYADNGRTVTVSDPMGRSSRIEIDAFGRTLKSYDGYNRATVYSYDDLNRKTTVTSPDGVSVSTTKTRTGETLEFKDGKGGITRYTYTKDGQLRTVQDAKTVIIATNTYDNSGRLYESSDALGVITRYSYDATNRVVQKAIDPTGLNIRTAYQFDGQGRQLSVTEGSGTVAALTTNYVYDRKGQIKQIIVDPTSLALSTLFTYDGVGQTIRVDKGTVSLPAQQTTVYTFDKLGRKTLEQQDPQGLNIRTQYKYDANGNLTRVIDPNGFSTWFIYNTAGQKSHQVDALGGVTLYEYDKNGRLHHTRQYATAISTTGLGDVVSSVSLPAANTQDRRSYNVYDNDGRVKYTLNAKSATEWTVAENVYDANGNVTALWAYDKTLTEANINSMTTVGSSEGALIVAAEVASFLTALGYSASASGQARVTRYEYDANNRQIKTTLPGWYSASAGKVSATAALAGSFQRTIEVTYDTAGNAVANKVRIGLSDYIYQYKTYDSAGREVNDIDGLGYVTQKTYDALGNVKTVTRSGNSIGVKTSGYWLNTAIAPQSGRTIRMDYDRVGRQEKVTQPNGGTTLYSYNAMGQVTKQSQLLTTGVTADSYFYYDAVGRQVLTVDAEKYGTKTEYDALGNVKKVTEYALATASALTTASLPSFATSNNNRITSYTHDAAGRVKTTHSTLNEYSSTQVKVDDKTYNAFGEVIESRDAQNNLTRVEYDRLGQMNRITEPGRLVAGTGVDVFKNQVTATPITEFTYDAFGQSTREVRRTSAGAGATITINHAFDLAGNEVGTQDAMGNWTYAAYDVSGKVVKQTQSISVTNAVADTNYAYTLEKRFEYDKAGRQISSIDVFNNGSQQSGQFNIYNGYGEVIEERKIWGAASANVTTLAAGANSSVVVNKYVYNAAGQMDYKIGAEGYTYFFYDLASRVIRTEQRAGTAINTATDRVTENVYDKLGRVLTQRLPKNSVTSSFGTTTTSVVTPVINRTYDRWGNVLTESGDTAQKTYQYNHNNQLLLERSATVTAIRYDGTTASSYVERKLNYDNLGRLLTETHQAFGGATGTRVVTSNTYNAAGQLTRTTDATGVAQNFTYDIHGNKVGSKDALGYVTVYGYDANGQLTSRALMRTSTQNVLTGYTSEQVTRQVYVTVSSGPYGGTTQVPKTERVVVGYNTTTTPVYSQVRTGTGPYGAPIYTTVQTGTTTTQTPIYETRNVYETVTVQHPVYTLVSTDYLVNQGQYRYDQAGRKYGEADAAGNYQYYKFDERNNITADRNRVGGIKLFEFDELGNKTAEKLRFYTTYNSSTSYGSAPVIVSTQYTDTLRTWSYRNPTNANDYVDYRSNLMQRQQIANDANQIYTYDYNTRGQLITEKRGGVTAVTYAYWENGLQKSITETNTVGYTTTNNISEFYYDRRGNRTVERHNTVNNTASHTSYSSYGGSFTVPASSTSTGNIYSYFNYDAQNRLTQVKSPSTTVNISGAGYATTNLTLLSYDYDEWGNRRRIQATYNTATSPVKTEWYSYDAAGRVLIEGGGSAGGAITIGAGKEYAYDGAGRRVKEFVSTRSQTYYAGGGSYGSPVGTSQIRTDRIYTYNDLGLVSQTTLQVTETGYYNRVSSSSEAINIYDNRGFNTQTILGTKNRTIASTYKNDGTLLTQTTTVNTGSQAGRRESYVRNSYNTSGDISNYQYIAYDINRTDNREMFRNNYSYQYITTYAGRQVSSIGVGSTQSGTAKGITHNSYDTRGRLTSSSITEAHITNSSQTGQSLRRFAYNTSGQIIAKAERRFGETAFKTQNYYYSPTGGELANLGGFGYNISPLSAVASGSSTPGSYTVNAGDTLMGIAATLFGDAKLWYLIADANGLNQGPTDAFGEGDIGRHLRIPNNDKTISNTSTNWKPYNPSEIIGDLTPNPTILPPPQKKGCGIVAQIIMVVVAVVLTVVTAGAAAVAMSAAATGTTFAAASVAAGGVMAAGSTALAGGMGMIGMAAAAAGGFVGSVGSQLVGKGMGVVDSFSLRQAVGSGLTAGFAAGAGSYFSGLKEGSALTSVTVGADGAKTVGLNLYGNMARGAASYIGAYASNKVAGLETHFNWTDLAVGSVSSGITGSSGNKMTDNINKLGNGIVGNTASNFFNSTVSSSLSRLTGRSQKQDWGAMAADAFGNALATKVVEFASRPSTQSPAMEVNRPDSTIIDEPSQSPRPKTETEAKQVRQALVSGNADDAIAAKDTASKFNYDFDLSGYDIDPKLTMQMNEIDSILASLENHFYIIDMFGRPAGNGETSYYEKASSWLSGARASDQASYDYTIDNAKSGIGAVFGAWGRALNNAAYDIADGVVGIYGLVSDSNLRGQALSGISGLASYAWDNPGEAASKAYGSTLNYFENNSLQEIGEDSLRFVAGGFATAGTGKAVTSVGSFSLNTLKNSQFVLRPMGSTLNSSFMVPVLNGFERITTVTSEMSARFQGMGYLDPIDNVFKPSPIGKTMAVDHIFPTAEIANLRGFNTLTKQQMTYMIRDIGGEFGNLQALPATFNASKGKSINWSMYKGRSLNTNYVENLRILQNDIAEKMQFKIREFQKLNQ